MNSVDKMVELLCLKSNETTFVFTSEVVARSFLEACARKNPNKAFFKDCAISWDTFQEKFTSYPRDKVRAIFTDRLLFVQQYFSLQGAMQKGAKNELKYYCDSKYSCSEPAYMRSIAKALPNMCKAFDLSSQESASQGGVLQKENLQLLDKVKEYAPAEMQADLQKLVPAYKAYLEQHGLYDSALYEPNFKQTASDGTSAKDYTLVFPQTFSKAAVLKALEDCKSVDFESSEDIPKLKLFTNSLAELRACLREVHSLLSNNVKPNDIAISCADYDAYMPYLNQEAQQRDITLTFNNARPISSYIPGKFFSALLRVKAENYSFASMKDLLLNLEFPYKDRELLVSILEKAVRCKCKEGPLYKWAYKFERLNPPALEEKKRLLEIDKGIRSVVDCKDPVKLRINVMILLKDLFAEKSWTEEQEENDSLEALNARIFGSCERELGNLSTHAKDVDLGKNGDLFGLFVDILKDAVYRPNTGKGNINVYKYPVAAGLAVKYHFVLGLTESNSKVLLNPYPCLPLETAKTLEEVKALEDEILKLHSQSLEGGYAWLSSAEEGFSGADVIPTIFLKEDRKVKVREVKPDSFAQEISVWKERKQPAVEFAITQKQKACFEKACESALSYDKATSFAPVPKPFPISVSMVKNFEECPYKGYAACKLKLSGTDFEPVMDDAAQIGNILHKALQRALENSDAKSIESIKKEDLLAQLETVLVEYEKTPEATDSVHVAHIRNKYSKVLPLILECVEEEPEEPQEDAKKKAKKDKPTDKKTQVQLGLMTCIQDEKGKYVGIEYQAQDLIPEETEEKGVIKFTGRMDCVLQDSEGYAVIDLKKNAKNHYAGKLDKVNLQVAIYAKMIEKEFGEIPKIGAFYSFEEGKFKFVWPKFGSTSQYDNFFYTETEDVQDINKSQNEYVDENYKARVKELGRIVSQKDFRAEPKVQKTCDTCSYYNLCRGGFQTV